MSNSTWVCFDCRKTVRRPDYTLVEVRCPDCGHPCRRISHTIRVPLKRANKAWEKLRVSLQKQAASAAERRDRNRVRRIHRIEQEIARLQALPANEGENNQIELLRKRLVDV